MTHGRTNLNVGALLIGTIALIWAPIPYWSDGGTVMIANWVNASGIAPLWTLYLLVAGALTFVGCLLPHRTLRFWGLSLLSVFYSSTSLLWLDVWSYNPTIMASVVFGVFSITILIRDTKRKPRKCQESNCG